MMEDEAVFSVLSQCFAPIEEQDWKQLTQNALWCDFLDGVRHLLQDDQAFGSDVAPLMRARKRSSLQEFLTDGEVHALFCPPSYEEKCKFASQHFTGGLPESALPIESLYTMWSSNPSEQTPFAQVEGLYLADSARYMNELVSSLGLSVPDMFSDSPDHLALELDLVAVMLRSGMQKEAQLFLIERFDWLTAYRMRLLSLGVDAQFYVALVDVVVGIQAQQSATSINVSQHQGSIA